MCFTTFKIFPERKVFMNKITLREKQVLMLVAVGLKDFEIAKKLNMSKCTVRSHLRRVFTKLEAKNRCEAVYSFIKKSGESLVAEEFKTD